MNCIIGVHNNCGTFLMNLNERFCSWGERSDFYCTICMCGITCYVWNPSSIFGANIFNVVFKNSREQTILQNICVWWYCSHAYSKIVQHGCGQANTMPHPNFTCWNCAHIFIWWCKNKTIYVEWDIKFPVVKLLEACPVKPKSWLRI